MTSALTPEDLVLLNRLATFARLLPAVVHDVNNALQVIGGSVEMLEEYDLPDLVRTRIDRIRTQNQRATALAINLMAFHRERADAVGRINLRDLVTRAVSLCSIGRASLVITLQIADGRSYMTTGNAAEVQQAVVNLIGNAQQALAGAPEGAIRVTMGEENNMLVVRVTDNGPGVPADLRARIFEPFFTTRSRNEAAGLGLPAARNIAERSGGSLELEPSTDGASFAMRLPKV